MAHNFALIHMESFDAVSGDELRHQTGLTRVISGVKKPCFSA
jgi:hypothetical protein